MAEHDLIVLGSGISGTSLAVLAARAGRRVLVAEREARAGGCLHTVRMDGGYWYELGAHTCYNSYGAFLELLEAAGLMDELQPRGKPVLRFLRDRELVPGKNLALLLKLFKKGELLAALPRWIGASSQGATVRSHYSRLVGAGNYEHVLRAMLSAVPSQAVDDFPADMLFKKRERRKDVLRSFTLRGGLQSAIEAGLGTPGIETRLEHTAEAIERTASGFAVTFSNGDRAEARKLALAVPPAVAGDLLHELFPKAAARMSTIGQARTESLGFVLPVDKSAVPYSTFLIPLRDDFHSVVTRDVVPDEHLRAFTFHFRPGHDRDEKLRIASEVLGVEPGDMVGVSERVSVLPSPVLGHGETIRAIDAELVGEPVAVTGNWFGGLAIEDCVLRSRGEWARLEKVS